MIVFLIWFVCFILTFVLCILYNKHKVDKLTLFTALWVSSFGILVLSTILVWAIYDYFNERWLRWFT